MSTKERLLALLEENRGSFLSGEEAAEALGVSRTAVWKAANALRTLGYAIDAVSNKGYCLSENADILCAGGIEKYLQDCCKGLKVQVRPSASSARSRRRVVGSLRRMRYCRRSMRVPVTMPAVVSITCWGPDRPVS